MFLEKRSILYSLKSSKIGAALRSLVYLLVLCLFFRRSLWQLLYFMIGKLQSSKTYTELGTSYRFPR